jgi:Flp pilus assembly pilin Flp
MLSKLFRVGATSIEYALLAALIGITSIGGASLLEDSIDQKLVEVGTVIQNAGGGATGIQN